MAKVEIYTKNYCPYCHAAKELFKDRGVEFVEYDVENDPAKREEMLKRAHPRTSVPEIFINDKLIGGFDDLQALDDDGKLDEMLA